MRKESPSLDRRSFLKSTFGLAVLQASSSPLFADEPSRPVVRTTSGLVRGRARDGIAAFLGISYGADTSTARFEPPRVPAPWAGIRDALTWGDRAPQLGGGGGMTSRSAASHAAVSAETYHLTPDEGLISEDCLHLNVWTPAPHGGDRKQRPVLVYIHGGAYNSGSANSPLYDGTRLARRGDVVVVTVNHRLNAFGYLYLAGVTRDPAFADSGNVGMLDLILALRWVRDNIAEFGGDPARVTIFGQSGGGAKCATLMAMPAAHGLFQGVMSMSGQQVTAAPVTIATDRTREFLKHLGIEDTSSDQLRAALQAAPLQSLEDAARVSSAWLPVVDGRSLPRDPFSPNAPPLSNNVAMILGNTHDETRGLIGTAHPELFSLTWDALPAALTRNIGPYLGPVTPETVVASYRRWYPRYSPADVFFAATTAFRSWPGEVIEAERRAESPAQPRTWVYQMNWTTPVGGGRFGAPHTVDIPFFFDNLAVAPGMVGASAAQISAAQPLATAMSDALVAFARTGNPNGGGLPHWPAYDLEHRATMLWDTRIRVEDDPRGEERKLAALAHYRQPGT